MWNSFVGDWAVLQLQPTASLQWLFLSTPHSPTTLNLNSRTNLGVYKAHELHSNVIFISRNFPYTHNMSSQQSLTELEFDLAPAKQTTSLLSLPLEIRQIIYTLVLPAQSTIYPNVSTLFRDAEQHERGRRFRKYERVLGLARTCQSFYIDFLPHYYGAKIFSFENAYDLYRYLHMCGPYRRRWIRNIEFWLQVGEEYWWGKKYWEIYEWAIELLRECPLMRLGIGVSSETVEKAKWPVRGLEGLKGMRLQRIEVMVREVRGWYSHGRGLLEEENAAEETERWLKTRRNFAKQELLSLETRVKGYMMSDADGPESKSDLPSKKDVFASGSGRSKRKVNPKAVVQRKSKRAGQKRLTRRGK